MNKKKEKRRFIILCLAPAVILFTVFMVYPTINVFLMSTLKWGGFSDEKTFVGLNNFLILFKDMNFIRAFQNTIFVIVIVTIFTLALAIIFASILVREKLKGQNFFRVIFYIPNILSIVVIGAIFSAIYDPSANGLLNSFLGLFMGKDWQGIPYLGNQSIVMYSIAFALIWQAIGYYMVILQSAIASIGTDVLESAEIDGANGVQKALYITLPLIKNTVLVCITLCIAGNMKAFDNIFVMTKGGPGTSSMVMAMYGYQISFNQSNMGYGSCISVGIFVLSLLVIGGSQALIKYITREKEA